ncbi:MAG: caspase family protein [Elusimicrobia bacterium]|nr:caspase family protein [Elusimicrobiota bacterium]
MSHGGIKGILAHALLAALALFIAASARAEKFDGGVPGSFLEFGSGARALGMGRAYAAVAEGPGSMLWNPAGLGAPARSELSLSRVTLFEGASLSEFSAAHSFARPFGLGISMLRFDASGAERRDAFNNPAGDITDTRTAYLLGLGWHPGERPRRGLTLGTTQKILQRTVDDQSAGAWDMDIGGLYDFGAQDKAGVRAGLQVQNIMAAGLARDGGRDKLPRTVRLGAAAPLGPLLVSADIIKRGELGVEFRTGLEYAFLDAAALRGGWDGASPTLGASLSWKKSGYSPALDYAILRHDILGISHRVSLRLAFGPGLQEKIIARSGWRNPPLAKPPEPLPVQPPAPFKIVIMEPGQGQETSEAQVRAAGCVEGEAEIESLKINGKEIGRKRGLAVVPNCAGGFQFQEDVPLVLGQNIIMAEATGRAGRAGHAQVMVVRKPAAPQRELPDLWIVAIGINDYQDDKLDRLRFAGDDAKAVSDFFAAQAGRGLFREIHAKVLLDAQADLVSMKGAFGSFFNDAKPDDFAVIFFAGHGVMKRGFGYIMAHNSLYDDPYPTAYRMSEFQEALTDLIPTRNTLALLDACHSGVAGTPRRLMAQAGEEGSQTRLRGDDDTERLNEAFSTLARKTSGRAVLTASRNREFSAEDPAKRHGIFTYHLLEALNGAADGVQNGEKDGKVTIGEMYDYLFDKVKSDTKGDQHPHISGDYDNNWPLAVVPR